MLGRCFLGLVGLRDAADGGKKDGVKSDQMKYDKAVCEYNAEVQAGPLGSLSSDQRAARKEQVKSSATCA